MTGRNCWLMLWAVFWGSSQLPVEANAQEAPATTGPSLSQPEIVQPSLAPRRRGVRARRYAPPRSLQSRPKPLPAPQALPQALPQADPQPAPADSDKGDKREPLIAPPSKLPTLLLQPPANSPGTPAPYSTKVNLNRATLEQIQRLPGITPGVAARILAGRPYRRIGELGTIGIPFEIIESIAPAVTFDP